MKPMIPRKLTTGELGWLGIPLYAIVVDSIAWRHQAKGVLDETMSVSFGKALHHPIARFGTLFGWGIITAHLFWSVPLPGSKSLKKLATRRIINRPSEEAASNLFDKYKNVKISASGKLNVEEYLLNKEQE